MKTFTVIYRSGGPHNCLWHKTVPVVTKREADARAANIERMGYKAIVHETRALDSIGMPVGWTPELAYMVEDDPRITKATDALNCLAEHLAFHRDLTPAAQDKCMDAVAFLEAVCETADKGTG